MPILTPAGGSIMPGYGPYHVAGAPVAGVSEVQTLTFGGTPTGGTFTLTFDGSTTTPISWSAVNATLVNAIDAALEALDTIPAGGVTTAVGTMTAGIGTITVTFAGDLAALNVPQMTATSSLTGTAPTLVVTTTTPGVAASHRGVPKGATLINTATGVIYANTGTEASPTWTAVGAQT